jgi:hypothetical protein
VKCGKRPCEKQATYSAVNRERGTVSYRCNEHILAFGSGRYSVEPLVSLEDRIAALLGARGQMSAADVTKALNESGDLPPYWTVIDVAGFLREWFSSNGGANG